jgi:hypothetical protein
MPNVKFAVSLILAALITAEASAVPIGFDSSPSEFGIEGLSEYGFEVEKSSPFWEHIGTVAGGEQEHLFLGNGTGRLLSWTNTGGASGFKLNSTTNSPFSLSSFQVGNGYVTGYLPITAVLVTGFFVGGGSITLLLPSSHPMWSFGWNTVTLGSEWTDLASVEFQAQGVENRAVWDNIVVDDVIQAAPMNVPNVANVPDGGSTAALLGVAMSGVLLARRKLAV